MTIEQIEARFHASQALALNVAILVVQTIFSVIGAITDTSIGGSLFKLLASELQKDIIEIGMTTAGCAGLEFEPRRPLHGLAAPVFPGCDLELVAMPRYLNMRVASIYGGSSEIQREIIAKHVLDLR